MSLSCLYIVKHSSNVYLCLLCYALLARVLHFLYILLLFLNLDPYSFNRIHTHNTSYMSHTLVPVSCFYCKILKAGTLQSWKTPCRMFLKILVNYKERRAGNFLLLILLYFGPGSSKYSLAATKGLRAS